MKSAEKLEAVEVFLGFQRGLGVKRDGAGIDGIEKVIRAGGKGFDRLAGNSIGIL